MIDTQPLNDETTVLAGDSLEADERIRTADPFITSEGTSSPPGSPGPAEARNDGPSESLTGSDDPEGDRQNAPKTPQEPTVLDNRLALDHLIGRCERVGLGWFLTHDPRKATPGYRYELRLFDGPARGIYRGATASHAASKAIAALDEHQVGWDQ